MRKPRLLLPIVLGLLVLAASSIWFRRIPIAALTDVDADVYEAVFRQRFDSFREAQGIDGLYLLVDHCNPPAEFLNYFADERPPVRPGSEYGPDTSIRLSASRLTWLTSGSVEVSLEVYMSSRRASHSFLRPAQCVQLDIITLSRRDGRWSVEDLRNVYVACG
jgi:hypothetical protein